MGGLAERIMHRTSNANDTGSSPVSPTIYIYFWNRMARKGQLCKVLVRGKMNSCLVEFEDGFKAVTSRNALRKVKDEARTQ